MCSLWLAWRWSSDPFAVVRVAASTENIKQVALAQSSVRHNKTKGYMVGVWGDGRSWPLASRF